MQRIIQKLKDKEISSNFCSLSPLVSYNHVSLCLDQPCITVWVQTVQLKKIAVKCELVILVHFVGTPVDNDFN